MDLMKIYTAWRLVLAVEMKRWKDEENAGEDLHTVQSGDSSQDRGE